MKTEHSVQSERLQLILPSWLKNELRKSAAAKGINMSEYIKDTLKQAVQSGKPN
jgi:predicted DNA binding CopG/RHH family protein